MSNNMRQIHRIENALAKGYTMRPTVTGGTYIQRRANNTTIIHRSKEKVTLTKGRRRMLEQKLAALKGCEKWLWVTKEPFWNEEMKVMEIVQKGGTYEHRLHGPLKRPKDMI